MKKLKPITRDRFKCDFCKKITYTEKAMELHENICYYNPNRDCDVCGNEGVEFFHGLGEGLGVIPDAYSEDCRACKIAKECGGRSYIEETQ